ncbi:hypothetical protein TNCV_2874191 [Trichonephila clavipes]|nr:hypothetical protein TNCV_2874191 [Trichonephila clavipes]
MAESWLVHKTTVDREPKRQNDCPIGTHDFRCVLTTNLTCTQDTSDCKRFQVLMSIPVRPSLDRSNLNSLIGARMAGNLARRHPPVEKVYVKQATCQDAIPVPETSLLVFGLAKGACFSGCGAGLSLTFAANIAGFYGRNIDSFFCMEWCRMFALRIVVWTVFLGCGLSFTMPDIKRDSLNIMSERDQKRLGLLKSLEEYSAENHQVIPAVKVISKF